MRSRVQDGERGMRVSRRKSGGNDSARRRMANCQTVLVSSILTSDSPFSSIEGLDSKLSRFTIPCRGQQDV